MPRYQLILYGLDIEELRAAATRPELIQEIAQACGPRFAEETGVTDVAGDALWQALARASTQIVHAQPAPLDPLESASLAAAAAFLVRRVAAGRRLGGIEHDLDGLATFADELGELWRGDRPLRVGTDGPPIVFGIAAPALDGARAGLAFAREFHEGGAGPGAWLDTALALLARAANVGGDVVGVYAWGKEPTGPDLVEREPPPPTARVPQHTPRAGIGARRATPAPVPPIPLTVTPTLPATPAAMARPAARSVPVPPALPPPPSLTPPPPPPPAPSESVVIEFAPDELDRTPIAAPPEDVLPEAPPPPLKAATSEPARSTASSSWDPGLDADDLLECVPRHPADTADSVLRRYARFHEEGHGETLRSMGPLVERYALPKGNDAYEAVACAAGAWLALLGGQGAPAEPLRRALHLLAVAEMMGGAGRTAAIAATLAGDDRLALEALAVADMDDELAGGPPTKERQILTAALLRALGKPAARATAPRDFTGRMDVASVRDVVASVLSALLQGDAAKTRKRFLQVCDVIAGARQAEWRRDTFPLEPTFLVIVARRLGHDLLAGIELAAGTREVLLESLLVG